MTPRLFSSRSDWSTGNIVKVTVIVLVFVLFVWAVHRIYQNVRADATAVSKVTLTQTEVPGGTLFTVTHDQHLWVWARPGSNRPGVLVHHPSCPCLAAPPERAR